MPCCTWKRSANDALLDNETGTSYCGTCWQNWIVSQQHRRPSKTKAEPGAKPKAFAREPSKSEVSVDQSGALVDDDASLGELEGVQHSGSLYLVSRSRRLVFATDRAADGRLVCVGELVRGTAGENHSSEVRLYKVETVATVPKFPFEVSPEDHCETPFDAYEDIAPYLDFLAKCLGKDRRTLEIWDPFYCNGAVKRNFAKLGFQSVHNECEDFYRVVETKQLPAHDCILTNPPYSTEPFDHVHRLVKILCAQQKPWFVLQPNYVYTKPFWEQCTSTKLTAPRPFFLTTHTPRKYKYKTPSGLRHVVSAQHLKTSPFVSMWFCWLGPRYTEKLYRWVASRGNDDPLPLSLACTEFFLPDSFKDSNDKTRRKPRKPKKRKVNPESPGVVCKETSPVKKKKRKRRLKT